MSTIPYFKKGLQYTGYMYDNRAETQNIHLIKLHSNGTISQYSKHIILIIIMTTNLTFDPLVGLMILISHKNSLCICKHRRRET